MAATFEERFNIQQVIRQGSLQTELAAIDVTSDKAVTLLVMSKQLTGDAKALERFYRQLRALERAESPHLQQVRESGRTEAGEPFVVLEPITGESLRQLLARQGPLAVADAVAIIVQACQGMDALHAQGMTHRSLQPANLWLSEGPPPLVRISDLAKIKTFHSELTADGEQLDAAPRYMSPEHLRSAKDVTPAADMWSLGVILFELLHDTHPYADRNSSVATVVEQQGRFDPHQLELAADIPDGVKEALLSCLDPDPASRCYSASELTEALLPFARRELLPEQLQPQPAPGQQGPDPGDGGAAKGDVPEPGIFFVGPDARQSEASADGAGASAPAALPWVSPPAPVAAPSHPEQQHLAEGATGWTAQQSAIPAEPVPIAPDPELAATQLVTEAAFPDLGLQYSESGPEARAPLPAAGRPQVPPAGPRSQRAVVKLVLIVAAVLAAIGLILLLIAGSILLT